MSRLMLVVHVASTLSRLSCTFRKRGHACRKCCTCFEKLLSENDRITYRRQTQRYHTNCKKKNMPVNAATTRKILQNNKHIPDTKTRPKNASTKFHKQNHNVPRQNHHHQKATTYHSILVCRCLCFNVFTSCDSLALNVFTFAPPRTSMPTVDTKVHCNVTWCHSSSYAWRLRDGLVNMTPLSRSHSRWLRTEIALLSCGPWCWCAQTLPNEPT